VPFDRAAHDPGSRPAALAHAFADRRDRRSFLFAVSLSRRSRDGSSPP
jgi:hypothetical protein